VVPERTADVEPGLIHSRDQMRAALTALRLRAGLTVRDLARRAQLPTATVGGYVTARHLPSPSQVEQFRAVLRGCGVTDQDLLARWDEALVRVRLSSDGRAGRRGADGDAPYRGLEPFRPDDADLFFGREDFVSLVLARLADLWHANHSPDAADPPEPRLLFVIGASGSGKSSLLRAGVYPAVVQGAIDDLASIEDAGAPSATPARWQATIMMPGAEPRAALNRALDTVAAPRLVVIDQFEELYTLTTDEVERGAFLADLAALGPDTLIVAGMRADFFPAAAQDAVVVSALQDWQMVVPPMSQAELRAAVVSPAAARSTAVDDALVEAVMADVFPSRGPIAAARQNALPLLSHAMLSTWEHGRRGRLTLADYRSVGGLAGAVQQSAEQAYGELTPAEQELARRG
jgi:transcriptional regulator with XRE-family HTH domain